MGAYRIFKITLAQGFYAKSTAEHDLSWFARNPVIKALVFADSNWGVK